MENFKKKIAKGLDLHKKGKIDESLEHYLQALKINDKNSQLLFLIGTAYLQKNNFIDSITFFEKTINLDRNNLGAYNNLGGALQNLKKYKKAIDIYKKLLLIKPNFSDGYNNIGRCLVYLKDFNNAIKYFEKAISLNPKDYVAYNNIGLIEKEFFNFNKALKNFEKSIEINKNYDLAVVNLGNTYLEMRNYELAKEYFKKLYEINPSYEFILGKLIYSKMSLCEWDELNFLKDQLKIALDENKKVIAPFILLALIDSPELQLKSAKIFSKHKIVEPKINSKIKKENGEKIKIGYFSPDFRIHPLLHLMEDIFKYHDKSKFDVYAFSLEPNKNDFMTDKIKPFFKEFFEIKSLSNASIFELSRKIGLDIAIDLCGYTYLNRAEIFSSRLAPVQINFLGYPGTMGAEYIDYIIADENIIPENEKENYSEDIIYLPNSYQPNTEFKNITKDNLKKKDYDLPENKIVYCNFGASYKITSEIFDLWMNILKEVPNSILWLLESNVSASRNIIKEAIKRNISEKRILFGKYLPHEQHLKRISLGDIFLDTYPCNAHTTASDSIKVGVPIITLTGRSFASRVCSSILKQVKMEELITKSPIEFRDKAIYLGKNQQKLTNIKDQIKKNSFNSSLFKPKEFTKNIEKIYKRII
ncbi:tetratricopeptide repeat protein [Candidatus Pelagibacter sp.]|nr:tetratricopeptide repeat protein [Candidatus Pelagibacter sp.]